MWAEIQHFLEKEWKTLKSAPLTFVVLSVLSLLIGYRSASWYLGRQIESKDDSIKRYRVALGIDKASEGALIELTNIELRAKALTVAAKIRQMDADFKQRLLNVQQWKKPGETDEKTQNEQLAIRREISNQFERTLRSDAVNIDNELRRRLSSKAISGLVNVPPNILEDADTKTKISIFGLMPTGEGISAVFLATLADSIDQMARLLPDK